MGRHLHNLGDEMKKPIKSTSSTIELEFDDFDTFGEIIEEFKQRIGRDLSPEEVSGIQIEKGNYFSDYTFDSDVDRVILTIAEKENPNYEQELIEYNHYLKVREAKKLITPQNLQYIANLEAMATSSKTKVEEAREFLKDNDE